MRLISIPAPDDAIVLRSERPGAAMFEGVWRTLLPWPEETIETAADDWKHAIAEMERDVPPDAIASDAPFLGGWAGFITYEAMATEEAARPRDAQPPEPPLFFARHRAGIVIDPRGHAFLFAPDGEEHRYLQRLQEHTPQPRNPATPQPSVNDSLAGDAYKHAVEAIRTAIRDGEVYQVNLTRSFTVDGMYDAALLYRTLTGTRPPRSAAFVRAPHCTIASASPEVLLDFDRVTGVAETRPIKGTIRRGGDDASEIAALIGSDKDAAEHLMIVDVSRNDLGKVAPPGAVSVPEFRAVRTLEYVHHLESTVRATGLGDRSAADILAALSPAASITGAPKRAAVAMIRELEPVPRGVYCGAIGFIGARRVEMSVAIRTAVATAESVRYHAGGGIVWDSDASAEDDECRAKAAPFMRFVC